jgi:hypothetical protein
MATLSFFQIVGGTARDRIMLFALATDGDVYEYNAAPEGWVPLPRGSWASSAVTLVLI